MIQSHVEKNKIVASRWRQMSEVEKTPYYERAKEGTCGTRGQPEKSWKEASRIIRNLESNVCGIDSIMLLGEGYKLRVGSVSVRACREQRLYE